MNVTKEDFPNEQRHSVVLGVNASCFHRRRFIVFSALGAVGAVGFSIASLSEWQQSSSVPSFEPMAFDCGQVALGEKFAVVFVVRNKSSSDLKVLRVSPDCGCMRLMSAPTVVKPNSSEQISLGFTASRRGQIDNLVLVDYLELSGGIEQPQRAFLRVTADVQYSKIPEQT